MTTPSETRRCRLCIKTCEESLTLYYENDQINHNLLQIASKYFRLEFLTRLQDAGLRFLCLECWKYISEFDNFRTMISLVQDLLHHHGVTQVAQIPDDDIQRTNDKTNIGAMADNPTLGNDELQIVDIGDTVMISSDEECAIAIKNNTTSTNIQSTNQDRDQPPSGLSTDSEYQSDLEDYEYDDPVGVFTDAQFDNESERATEAIELNSHNNSEMPGFLKKPTSERTESKTKISGSNTSKNPKPSRNTTKWDKNLNCPLCKKISSRFHFINEHFKSKHPDEKCYVECCGNKYFQRHGLENHMKKVHANAKALESTTTTTPHIMEDKSKKRTRTSPSDLDFDIAKWRENLECYICKAYFTNFGYLKEHFNQKHPGETTYVMCCERKFPTRSQLIQHILLHLDANIFQCKQCGKRCSSTLSLKGHKLRRHNMIT